MNKNDEYYHKKYLKYKIKYTNLLKNIDQSGGGPPVKVNYRIDAIDEIYPEITVDKIFGPPTINSLKDKLKDGLKDRARDKLKENMSVYIKSKGINLETSEEERILWPLLGDAKTYDNNLFDKLIAPIIESYKGFELILNSIKSELYKHATLKLSTLKLDNSEKNEWTQISRRTELFQNSTIFPLKQIIIKDEDRYILSNEIDDKKIENEKTRKNYLLFNAENIKFYNKYIYPWKFLYKKEFSICDVKTSRVDDKIPLIGNDDYLIVNSELTYKHGRNYFVYIRHFNDDLLENAALPTFYRPTIRTILLAMEQLYKYKYFKDFNINDVYIERDLDIVFENNEVLKIYLRRKGDNSVEIEYTKLLNNINQSGGGFVPVKYKINTINEKLNNYQSVMTKSKVRQR